MLVVLKRWVKHLGNRDIAQLQWRNGLSVLAYVNRRGAFGPHGCATAKVDAKVQPLQTKGRQSDNHHKGGNTQPDLPLAEEIERGFLGNKS
jgi:hypothetical protein